MRAALLLVAAFAGQIAHAEEPASVLVQKGRPLDLRLRQIEPVPIEDAASEHDPTPDIPNVELDERVRFLDREIARNARLTRVWFALWSEVYAAGLVVQSARAAVETKPAYRADFTVSAAKAVIGTVGRLARPPRAVLGPTAAELAPGGSHAARSRHLVVAEAMLRLDAKDNDRRYSWLAHTLNLGLNLAGALIVGFGYHDWRRGLESAAIGVAVGELSIWSQPWGAKRAWKRYALRYGIARPQRAAGGLQAVSVMPGLQPGGASGALSFSF